MFCLSSPPDFKLLIGLAPRKTFCETDAYINTYLTFVQFPFRRRSETSSTLCVAAWWKKAKDMLEVRRFVDLGCILGTWFCLSLLWICSNFFWTNFGQRGLRNDCQFSSLSLYIFTFSAHVKNFLTQCLRRRQASTKPHASQMDWSIIALISHWKLPRKGDILGRCCWSTHWF